MFIWFKLFKPKRGYTVKSLHTINKILNLSHFTFFKVKIEIYQKHIKNM